MTFDNTTTQRNTDTEAAELDRDLVCPCPYCELYRYGRNIPEPSVSERLQASMRVAARGTFEDHDALSRARNWADAPEGERERITSDREYQQLRRVAEWKRADTIQKQEAHKKPAPEPNAPRRFLGNLDLLRELITRGVVRIPAGDPAAFIGAARLEPAPTPEPTQEPPKLHLEQPYRTFTITGIDPGFADGSMRVENPQPELREQWNPQAQRMQLTSAPQAYAEQMSDAIARLGSLLKDDEEMCQLDREIAILRLAEIRLLWEDR